MKYYKIIKDENFIGIITSADFRRYDSATDRLLSSNEVDGEFIRFEDKLYRDYWMPIVPADTINFISAKILEIEESEYNLLANLQESNQLIPASVIPQEYDTSPIEEVNINDGITLEYVRTAKLRELSKACNAAIENGVIVELDGVEHTFSLTTQDQINLAAAEQLLNQGELEVPYHADGEVYKFFSAVNMRKVIEAANTYRLYHTSYYNSLKAYINSLASIEAIAAIAYEDEVPEEYWNEVFKSLN